MAPPSSAAAGNGDAAAAPLSTDSLLNAAKGLWRELPGLVSDRVELLSLELQRAGLALLQIVVLVIAAAILGVTAWLLLCGGVAAFLVTQLDTPWWAAVLAVVASNVLLAWWAIGRVRGLLPLLQLPATRRRLMFSPSTAPAGPPRHRPPEASATP